MKQFLRYYHTIRYLKLQQILYQLYYRFFHPSVSTKISVSDLVLRRPKKQCVDFCQNPIEPFNDKHATFLNCTADVSPVTIWNDVQQEKLWLYNLHYFDALNAQSQAQQKIAHQLLSRWINENPPFTGNAWEPYPVSLRLVNVIKYALSGHELSDKILASIYVQARFLVKHCEYHLLGNHLFENFKALCFAGLFFDSHESQRWFECGFSGLKKQVKEQILPDGGHFELSPMYHGIILEGLLDLHNLFVAYSYAFPWRKEITKMLSWLAVMQRSNGEYAYFNDAAQSIAQPSQALFDYACRGGAPSPPKGKKASQSAVGVGLCVCPNPVNYLKDSGYIIVNQGSAKLIVDAARVGPEYLPGHAHADTLSFELCIGNQPVFVNLGTSCYGLSDRRQFERGTKAHNTVCVDGHNSSEVWAGFRVARRASVRDFAIKTKDAVIEIKAGHDGFCRFKDGMMHHRKWQLSNKKLMIEDRVSKSFRQAVAWFHLHPNCKIIAQDKTEISIVLSNGLKVNLVTQQSVEIYENLYAQAFGDLRKAQSIAVFLDSTTQQSLAEIEWR